MAINLTNVSIALTVFFSVFSERRFAILPDVTSMSKIAVIDRLTKASLNGYVLLVKKSDHY